MGQLIARTAASINVTRTPGTDRLAAAHGRNPECKSHLSRARGVRAPGVAYDIHDPIDDPPAFRDGFPTNQAAVAHDLVVLLDRFYELHPDQLKSRLYVTGESYGGKYVPHLALQIHRVNLARRGNAKNTNTPKSKDTDVKSNTYQTEASRLDTLKTKTKPVIPLAGIAIGSGLTDPITQIAYYAPQALALGLVSRDEAAEMKKFVDIAIGHACKGEWLHALSTRLQMFDYFRNVTGGINWYDVRKADIPKDWSRMDSLLRRVDIKRAINVGADAHFGPDPRVFDHLAEDIMKSSAGAVAAVLDSGYRVLLYQGQFDFRDGIMASSEWIEGLGWHGHNGYRNASRDVWRAPLTLDATTKHVAGYVRKYANLVRVEVLNAGHLVPMDQGAVSLRMITDMLVSLPEYRMT